MDTRLLTQLRSVVRGGVSTRGDADFETGRRLWNAAIDRKPLAVVHCTDAQDVAAAVRFATLSHLPYTVKGGGHNVAGRSVQDGALLIDLSAMNRVTVRPAQRVALVEGGALWRDVDAATAEHDLATVGGLVSSTGVGGFTLGGGAGWLMRRFGLASDNVVGMTVVLPDGQLQHVSAHEHPGLFWGLRGGGGLLPVTEFEFRLHQVRNVLAGILVHPAEEAASVLRLLRDFAADAPDEFCGLLALVHLPPIPFITPDWHGRPVAIMAVCWSGDLAAGPAALRPLLSFGSPVATHVAAMPYWQWQRSQDAGTPPGRAHYWKSANLETLSDATVDELAGLVHRLPTPFTEIHVQHLGGAVARAPGGSTAFAHRDARFFVNFIGTAERTSELPGLVATIRDFHERLAPVAFEKSMPNFDGTEDAGMNEHYDATRVQRLEELRARYGTRPT